MHVSCSYQRLDPLKQFPANDKPVIRYEYDDHVVLFAIQIATVESVYITTTEATNQPWLLLTGGQFRKMNCNKRKKLTQWGSFGVVVMDIGSLSRGDVSVAG